MYVHVKNMISDMELIINIVRSYHSFPMNFRKKDIILLIFLTYI